MESSAKVMRPEIFCITNVKGHHLREYRTIENILYDKASLDRYASNGAVGIINGDDDILCNYDFKHKIIKCGIRNQNCDYVARNIKQDGLKLKLEIWNEGVCYPVSVNLLGEYNAYNVLFAFAIAKEGGIPTEDIILALNNFKNTDRKRQFVQEVAGRTLIVDCFNVAVDSVLGGMKILNDITPENSNAKKIAVIGGENRLGKTAFSENYKLGLSLAQFDNIDKMIFYGHSPETSVEVADSTGHSFAVYQGAEKALDIELFYEWNVDECAHLLKKETQPGDYVYFKGHCYKPMWSIIDKAFGTNYQFETAMQLNGIVRENGYRATRIKELEECVITAYAGDLENLIIPDVIGESAVHGLNNSLFQNKTIRNIDFGNSIAYIGDLCFEKCADIKDVELPSSCKFIGKNVFSSCNELNRVMFKSVQTISGGAFANCPQLREVIFAKDCFTIEQDAFSNCPNIVIWGPAGGNVEQYATRNNIPFHENGGLLSKNPKRKQEEC